VFGDYVACMTDRYAAELHARSFRRITIFKPLLNRQVVGRNPSVAGRSPLSSKSNVRADPSDRQEPDRMDPVPM